MSRYSIMRALLRSIRPQWSFAILVAALAACAPASPVGVQPAAQSATIQADARSAGQPATQPVTQPVTHPVTPPATQPNAPPPPARSAAGPLPVPPNLVALAQPAGQKRLTGAASNQSYWPLSQYFETQRNEAYCSVATSVMALNALGIRRPASTQYPDFPFFSQDDFFRSVDPQVANAAQVSREGMTLDQLASALDAFPVSVGKYHAVDLSLDQFRDLVRATTARSDRFVLLNFRRMEIGEAGGGHWSPLGAYDRASDSALLLDVARYKYPAVWVPVAQLYAAALAVDSVSGLSRGILIIGKRPE